MTLNMHEFHDLKWLRASTKCMRKKEISERVYNRLRKEQVDRLNTILEKTRRTN